MRYHYPENLVSLSLGGLFTLLPKTEFVLPVLQ